MTLDEMKAIADRRTKAEWRLDLSPYSDDAVRVFREETVHVIGPTDPRKNQDAKFIAMAAKNWDKMMAVVEAAKSVMDKPGLEELRIVIKVLEKE